MLTTNPEADGVQKIEATKNAEKENKPKRYSTSTSTQFFSGKKILDEQLFCCFYNACFLTSFWTHIS